ncbi:hypothetical protein [Bordetella sp. H567]|uniref:hypothetical protein n=1 Tax=Bordetella sp. H567 TaxID=1697043 RepID=UPI0011AB73CF|nr:hypothetical protein [Bordetella sp. H567]
MTGRYARRPSPCRRASPLCALLAPPTGAEPGMPACVHALNVFDYLYDADEGYVGLRRVR